MYLISHNQVQGLKRLLGYLIHKQHKSAMDFATVKTMGEIPQAVQDILLTPTQGRCPKKCSQGLDESTGENCTHCSGWGFVEASKVDPWIYDMEAAKSQHRCMLITETGGVLSPCSWSKPGEISEDGFWIIWNRAAPEYFEEVRNPVGWMPIPESKRYPFNAQKEENPTL